MPAVAGTKFPIRGVPLPAAALAGIYDSEMPSAGGESPQIHTLPPKKLPMLIRLNIALKASEMGQGGSL